MIDYVKMQRLQIDKAYRRGYAAAREAAAKVVEAESKTACLDHSWDEGHRTACEGIDKAIRALKPDGGAE